MHAERRVRDSSLQGYRRGVLPGSFWQSEAVWGGPPGTAGVSPTSGPHNKVPWRQELSLPVRSSVPTQPAGCRCSQHAGAPGTSPAKSPRSAICLLGPAKGLGHEIDLQFSFTCTRYMGSRDRDPASPRLKRRVIPRFPSIHHPVAPARARDTLNHSWCFCRRRAVAQVSSVPPGRPDRG